MNEFQRWCMAAIVPMLLHSIGSAAYAQHPLASPSPADAYLEARWGREEYSPLDGTLDDADWDLPLVERGTLSLETALIHVAYSESRPFLLRFGLLEDLELRLSGRGLDYQDDWSTDDDIAEELALGFRLRLSDYGPAWYRPSVTLEVEVETPKELQGLDEMLLIQPSTSLGVKHRISERLYLSWSVDGSVKGMHLQVDPRIRLRGAASFDLSRRWRVYGRATGKFELLAPEYSQESSAGAGIRYRFNRRVSLRASYDRGLSPMADAHELQVGVSVVH